MIYVALSKLLPAASAEKGMNITINPIISRNVSSFFFMFFLLEKNDEFI